MEHYEKNNYSSLLIEDETSWEDKLKRIIFWSEEEKKERKKRDICLKQKLHKYVFVFGIYLLLLISQSFFFLVVVAALYNLYACVNFVFVFKYQLVVEHRIK